MFCCAFLDNMIRSAGSRGLSLLVCKTDDGIKFALQMRAVEYGEESGLAVQPSPGSPEYLTLSASVMIRYCPSCGRRLAELVAASPSEFSRLAMQHADFQDDWGA